MILIFRWINILRSLRMFIRRKDKVKLDCIENIDSHLRIAGLNKVEPIVVLEASLVVELLGCSGEAKISMTRMLSLILNSIM